MTDSSSQSVSLFVGIDDQSLLPIISVVADAYFLIYVLAARRVRDTFFDFPPPLETAAPNRRIREG